MENPAPLEFSVNGKIVRMGKVDPNLTVLNYLRDSDLCGTKEGCAEGDCGACTVVVLEPDSSGNPRYSAVNSCLMLLPMAHGLELWTAEGIGSKEAQHPVQLELGERGGSQCGYCTPGFVMSLFAEYYRPDRTEAQEDALVGNLCRCTGYRPIREALHALEQPQQDDIFLERMVHSLVQKKPLESALFVRPVTLEGALKALEHNSEARFIAGGTDLALERTTAFKDLGVLISLEAIPELLEVVVHENRVEVGAGVTLSRLEGELEALFPLLEELWPWFASRQIRNRATLGGNLGSASPIGDANVVLLALEAEIVLVRAGSSGLERRTLPLSEYFLSYRKTALKHGEIIEKIVLPRLGESGTYRASPRQNWTHQAAYKVAKRGHDDISSVLGAFVLKLNSSGVIVKARLAYGGVAAIPARAVQTETFLEGNMWNRYTLEGAKKVLEGEFTPLSDFRASKEYRSRIVVNLLEKFFLEKSERVDLVV